MTFYQQKKEELKSFADSLKTLDKPQRREALNNYTDQLIRDINNNYKEGLSDSKKLQYSEWLVNYCIARHKK